MPYKRSRADKPADIIPECGHKGPKWAHVRVAGDRPAVPLPLREGLFMATRRSNSISYFCAAPKLLKIAARADHRLVHSWGIAGCPQERESFHEEQVSVRTLSIPRHRCSGQMMNWMKRQGPPPSGHARVRNQSFVRALIGVLAGRTFVSPRFSPPRCPTDARSEDMARIGADMYRSFQLFTEGQENWKASAE